MRRIQIERKLFELFGYKFFVFENFQDADLNIDDHSIYQYDNQEELVDIFASNHFFAIWSDEKRLNSGLICACEGHLNLIIAFLKKIGIKQSAYFTSDCGLAGEPRVLYLESQDAMHLFVRRLYNSASPTTTTKKLALASLFGVKDRRSLP